MNKKEKELFNEMATLLVKLEEHFEITEHKRFHTETSDLVNKLAALIWERVCKKHGIKI